MLTGSIKIKKTINKVRGGIWRGINRVTLTIIICLKPALI